MIFFFLSFAQSVIEETILGPICSPFRQHALERGARYSRYSPVQYFVLSTADRIHTPFSPHNYE